MTRIWLVNWHFQSRITLCRHKSTNVSMGLCWQMPKFIVWHLWSIYFDHHLPLKLSIGKRRKQSCTPNIFYVEIPRPRLYEVNFMTRLWHSSNWRCAALLSFITFDSCRATNQRVDNCQQNGRIRKKPLCFATFSLISSSLFSNPYRFSSWFL